MARDLAIDLGTANTLVYARGEGIVLAEPSVIALNTQNREVLAMGSDAWRMIGRTPSHVVAHRPLRKGAITDFDVTGADGRRIGDAEALLAVVPTDQQAGLESSGNGT